MDNTIFTIGPVYGDRICKQPKVKNLFGMVLDNWLERSASLLLR